MMEKEDFVQETMMLDVEAKISIKLAMSIPVSVDGSAAYQMNEDSTSHTHSFILEFNKVSHIHEIPKESYSNGTQDTLMTQTISAK